MQRLLPETEEGFYWHLVQVQTAGAEILKVGNELLAKNEAHTALGRELKRHAFVRTLHAQHRCPPQRHAGLPRPGNAFNEHVTDGRKSHHRLLSLERIHEKPIV